MKPTVAVSNLSKTFRRRGRGVNALAEIDLTVEENELLVLLGPSGCGKTTLLRCLAGLEDPTTGSIELSGNKVVDAARGHYVAPNRRDVGMVFQNYALWPHMSVADNVAYPLQTRRVMRAERSDRVLSALRLVQCDHLADRFPPELSGGQQQRISLARALVARPALVLFDEPLSNLDALLRVDLRAQLRELHRTLGFTGVYVTHDQSEAIALGTRVAVMKEGRIEQIGIPQEVYNRPETEYVADFLGARNRFPLVVSESGASILGRRVGSHLAERPVGEYFIRVRPSAVAIAPPEAVTDTPDIAWMSGGRVVEVLPGAETDEYVVELADSRFFVDADARAEAIAIGTEIMLGLDRQRSLVYPSEAAAISE